jgi:hypothetical protein
MSQRIKNTARAGVNGAGGCGFARYFGYNRPCRRKKAEVNEPLSGRFLYAEIWRENGERKEKGGQLHETDCPYRTSDYLYDFPCRMQYREGAGQGYPVRGKGDRKVVREIRALFPECIAAGIKPQLLQRSPAR